MITRLNLILENYQLSPARLADKMGVQRSGISHILSGRNKPGFDFLVRLLELFPDIDANWLLTGKGTPFRDKSQSTPQSTEPQQKQAIPRQADLFSMPQAPDKSPISVPIPDPVPNTAASSGQKISPPPADTSSPVEGIFVLYKNGEFKFYRER